jgi:uncharacterized protein YbjT (DUF2867 family)
VKIAITGANSAVGQAVLRSAALEVPPPSVVAAVRSDRAASALPPLPDSASRVARISYGDGATLRAAFDDVAAVIHLAGVLVERRGSSYEDANVETTRRVAEAAKACGVTKLVLVSAVGADEASANGYWRTKGQAEAVVRAAGLSHTVLRVPLLLGRGTEAAAALARRLGARTTFMISGGRTLQQPLDVDDLARAAIIASDPGVAKDRTLDLVGPVCLQERDIVERAARLLGRPVRIRSIPRRLVWLALATRRRLRGPGFSPDALHVITTDTRMDPAPAVAELGLVLTGMDDMIRHSLEPGARA